MRRVTVSCEAVLSLQARQRSPIRTDRQPQNCILPPVHPTARLTCTAACELVSVCLPCLRGPQLTGELGAGGRASSERPRPVRDPLQRPEAAQPLCHRQRCVRCSAASRGAGCCVVLLSFIEALCRVCAVRGADCLRRMWSRLVGAVSHRFEQRWARRAAGHKLRGDEEGV